MIGSLFAGTDESARRGHPLPGPQLQGVSRHGSVGAMRAGRTATSKARHTMKLVPEGVEGRVPYEAPVAAYPSVVGGLKAAMGYTGNRTVPEMQANCNFVKITNAGLRESHVHDIMITNEAPNYRRDL